MPVVETATARKFSVVPLVSFLYFVALKASLHESLDNTVGYTAVVGL